jgi:hypothetical protein
MMWKEKPRQDKTSHSIQWTLFSEFDYILFLPCLFLPCLVFVLSCRNLSCRIVSCLVLPCLVLPSVCVRAHTMFLFQFVCVCNWLCHVSLTYADCLMIVLSCLHFFKIWMNSRGRTADSYVFDNSRAGIV